MAIAKLFALNANEINEENVATWHHSVLQNNIVVFVNILYWKYTKNRIFGTETSPILFKYLLISQIHELGFQL